MSSLFLYRPEQLYDSTVMVLKAPDILILDAALTELKASSPNSRAKSAINIQMGNIITAAAALNPDTPEAPKDTELSKGEPDPEPKTPISVELTSRQALFAISALGQAHDKRTAKFDTPKSTAFSQLGDVVRMMLDLSLDAEVRRN